ncbi:MAG: PAS domain S-box protein [Dehalococcoidia bacterium]|nr:PAS domain S-box protein [Dehalococcoidia bacterium]
MKTPQRFWTNYHFWIIATLFVAVTLFLYRDVIWHTGLKSEFFLFNLSRHTIERNLFLLITLYTGFVFGILPTLFAIIVSLCVMFPQAILYSGNVGDSLLEVALVTIAGLVFLSWQRIKEADDRRYKKAVSALEKTQEQLQTRIREARANARRLATLNTISNALSQYLDPAKVIETAVEMVGEVMEVEVILVYTIDPMKNDLVLTAYEGISSDSAKELDQVKLGEGFNGEVAATGEVMLVPDASNDPRLTRPAVIRNKMHPMLIVPMKSKGAVIGTLCVAMRRPRTFLPDEIDLLSTIAGQIASALTNARLYEEAREIADKLYKSARDYRNLFENAHDAIWFHDLDGKILGANKAAEELTGYPTHEFIGSNVREFMDKNMLKLARDIRNKLLSGEPFEQPYEQQNLRKDGERRTFMLTSSLMAVDDKPVGFQHIGRDVTDERRMQKNLRFYLNQITRAQEEERKRIARELHDDTAQALFALSRLMDNFIRDNIGLSQQQKAVLNDIRQRLGVTLQGIRRFSQDLRPSIIDDLGLLPAVKWLVKQKSEESGIDISLTIGGKEQRLIPEMELIIFRVIQEALNNMIKHACASKADVIIEFADSGVTASIYDNGKGFELPETVGDLSHMGKLGLVGMQERISLINGSLVIKTEKDRGTLVTVNVPIKI